MFEISIFCVILFAIAYWATLFIMGRREDVLHGEFVEAEPDLLPVATGPAMPRPGAVMASASVVPTRPFPPRPEIPAPVPVPAVAPAPAPVAEVVQPDTDALQSLLVSIKQELKNAAKI